MLALDASKLEGEDYGRTCCEQTEIQASSEWTCMHVFAYVCVQMFVCTEAEHMYIAM